LQSMEVIEAMAIHGNPNSVSDAGVGALCARAAVLGAFMNVRINATGCTDEAYVQKVLEEGTKMEKEALLLEEKIRAIVYDQIDKL
jgi:glutamate formiminotransferase/formiminotetrahydrofolate cyclodeaminase